MNESPTYYIQDQNGDHWHLKKYGTEYGIVKYSNKITITKLYGGYPVKELGYRFNTVHAAKYFIRNLDKTHDVDEETKNELLGRLLLLVLMN